MLIATTGIESNLEAMRSEDYGKQGLASLQHHV